MRASEVRNIFTISVHAIEPLLDRFVYPAFKRHDYEISLKIDWEAVNVKKGKGIIDTTTLMIRRNMLASISSAFSVSISTEQLPIESVRSDQTDYPLNQFRR